MKEFKNHNYKVIEKKEDWKDSVIEKDNITATFSIRDFENNIERITKTIKEITAKFNHEEVVIKNIEQHHPWVKDLSEQDLYTAWMYQEAKEVVKQFKPRIDQFNEALAKEIREVGHVKTLLAEELGVKEKKDGE